MACGGSRNAARPRALCNGLGAAIKGRGGGGGAGCAIAAGTRGGRTRERRHTAHVRQPRPASPIGCAGSRATGLSGDWAEGEGAGAR